MCEVCDIQLEMKGGESIAWCSLNLASFYCILSAYSKEIRARDITEKSCDCDRLKDSAEERRVVFIFQQCIDWPCGEMEADHGILRYCISIEPVGIVTF